MGLYENMPFARGNTYFGQTGGAVAPTLDDTAAANYVGREYVHMDNTYGTGTWVKVRVVRNDSGISLAPGFLCKVSPQAPTAYNLSGSTTAGSIGFAAALGYTIQGNGSIAAPASPEKGYVIDELLTFSVPKYDLFYVVVKGPTKVYTSVTAGDYLDGGTQIAVGDFLHAATAAASTSNSTAGRVGCAYFGAVTSATTPAQFLPMYAQLHNVVGRAMSAVSSAVTATNTTQILIEAGFGLWEI